MSSFLPSILKYLIFFIMLWLITSIFLSVSSGWYFIANNYPVKEIYKGDSLNSQTMQIGLVGFSRCITIGADKSRLFLAVDPIFSFAESPISIPLSDISTHRVSTAPFFPAIELKLSKVPGASIRIYKSQEDWIKQKAGDSWPNEQ